MQDFLRIQWKNIFLGVSAGAVALLLIKMSRDPKKKQPKKKNKDFIQSYLTAEIPNFDFPEISADSLSKNIDLIYDGEYLSMEAIKTIWESSIELIKKDFVILSLKNRKERRNVYCNDKKKYILIVAEMLEEIEKMLMKAQDDLLEALSVEKEFFEESLAELFNEGLVEQTMMIQVDIRYKLKYIYRNVNNLLVFFFLLL